MQGGTAVAEFWGLLSWLCLLWSVWFEGMEIGFIESLRLEKSYKIIKSNCQHSTSMAIKPCLHVCTFFEHLQGWLLPHSACSSLPLQGQLKQSRRELG